MNKGRKWIVRLGAVVLGALCLTVGVSIAAGEGTQADPLVTLSYLTKTVIPDILSQVDGKAGTYQEKLVDQLDQSIRGYSAQMEMMMGDESERNAAVYTLVTLENGRKLTMEAGCEVLLRGGTAQCVSASGTGFVNTTAGTALNNGETLAVNNLYVATATGQGIKAASDKVNVLVRGGYTIG